MSLGLGSAIRLVSTFEDDPSRGFTFIFGDENTGTSSLAYSIVDVIAEDKKVYVLPTEPPHNITGIIKKSFKTQYEAGKFVIPVNKAGESIPIGSFEQFTSWKEMLLGAKDVGAIVIDALDSVVAMLYKFFEGTTHDIQKIWTETYDAVRDLFLDINTKMTGIPVIVITKEKADAIYSSKGGKKKITPVLNEDGTPVIVPNIGKKVLRWASIRVRLTKKGHYIAMKTKGDIEEQDEFFFTKEEGTHKLTGTLLPQLFDFEKVR